MNQSDTKIVTDKNGQRGIIESMPDSLTDGNSPVTVRLDNGQKLLVPLEVLAQMNDGSYHLPFTLSEFLTSTAAPVQETTLSSVTAQMLTASESIPNSVASTIIAEHQTRADASSTENAENTNNIVVPVIEEALAVGKRVVETGGVRINKTVHERQETVDIPLIEHHADVERVTINRVISESTEVRPEVRREGDTLIIPLFEEVFVVEKRLILKEELHIRMRSEEVHKPQEVTLRREEVSIERLSSGTEAIDSEPQSSQSPVQTPV